MVHRVQLKTTRNRVGLVGPTNIHLTLSPQRAIQIKKVHCFKVTFDSVVGSRFLDIQYDVVTHRGPIHDIDSGIRLMLVELSRILTRYILVYTYIP